MHPDREGGFWKAGKGGGGEPADAAGLVGEDGFEEGLVGGLRCVGDGGEEFLAFAAQADDDLRALAEERPRLGSLRTLQQWAQAHDVVLRDGAVPGEVELVVAD